MKLTYHPERKRFEAKSDFAERAVLKAAGFAWDGVAKVWHTDHWKEPGRHSHAKQSGMAARFVQFADEATKARIAPEAFAAVELEKVSLETSRADSSNIEIPMPTGIELLPFQKAGVAYILKRPRTLLADEQGLGKTPEAIATSNADPAIRTVLVVCPGSLKPNWKREWETFDAKHLTVDYARSNKKTLPDTDVVIVNYQILKKHSEALRARQFDMLVVDEAQHCTNSRSQRTEYLLGRKATKRKNKETGKLEPVEPIAPLSGRFRELYLSGTPLNKPVELFPLLERLDPDDLGSSFFKYAKRYCSATKGKFGWDFSGASNLDELQEKMRSKFMIRRLKADVMKELPPKRRQIVILSWDDVGTKQRDEIKAALAREKAVYDRMESTDAKVAKIAFQEMAAARQQTAVAKIPFVTEYLKDLLEEVNKVIVFVHHREFAESLSNTFGTASTMVHGDVKIEERQAAVDRFQKDPSCKLFIGTIKAAGTGLTLTAASTVVFGELAWTPGDVMQAEDRAHRKGQTEAVLIKHLVLDDSLDANMVEKIVAKQNVIDAALNTVHEKPVLLPHAVAVGGGSPPGGTRTNLKEPCAIPPEEIEAIHAGLRILAGMCDGAVMIDGHGFNARDTNFGKSLAAQATLTQKQAGYGKRMLTLYRRQLPEHLLAAAGIQKKAA